MTPNMKSLGIDQLPRDVQLALVQEIWDNLATETNRVPLSEKQRIELDRRLAEDEANPSARRKVVTLSDARGQDQDARWHGQET